MAGTGLPGHAAEGVDAVAPRVRRELSVAGVPAQAQDRALAGYRTCARDRAREKDPAAVPPSCAIPPPGGAATARILGAHAPEAQGVTFSRAFRTGMYGVAGLMALVTLLMLSLPRFAVPREP